MTRDDIVKILTENKSAVVTFTKKDGTLRNMNCTRNFDVIPTESHPKGGTERQENLLVITAFDLDKDAWRSFRVDSVTDVVVSES